jgi:hypothetical protein
MKYLALFVAFLSGSYNLQAQAYVITTDSTAKITHSIALDLPFIGILSIETPSYAFQQATIPFQIPITHDKRFSFSQVDTLVSAPCLPRKQESVLMDVDSLDVDG